MNQISPNDAALAALVREQETDSLDDGFPYEHTGADIMLERGMTGWMTPTAFQVVALKELLQALVSIYGYQGHALLREIGRDNLRSPTFVSAIGLSLFGRLYNAALAALPADEQRRLGFVE